MNKRIVGNVLKYTLAVSLMTWVVWSNWGDPRGTVGRIVVGGEPAHGKITGRVVAYEPNLAITIETSAAEGAAPVPRELALKKSGKRLGVLPVAGVQIVDPDGTPLGGDEPLVGRDVTLSEVSRGLSYVWQRHVVEGEPIHTGYLLLAFVFGFVALLITFVRWFVLVRAVDLPFRLFDALRLGFLGYFFNTFLPGSVGGDAVKAWFLAKGQNRRTVAVATVIMDRAIALWALVWFVALLGAAFWAGGLLVGEGADQCRRIVQMAWIIVGTSLTAWLLLGLLPNHRAERFAGRLSHLPKVGHAAAEFWRAVWMYRCRQASVFGVLALSWIGHVGFVFLFYFSARALWDAGSGQQIPTLTQHFLIVPIGLVINALPLFPGGAGIGELGFGKLYEWLGCSEASGVLGSLVQRVLTWTQGLVSYIAYRSMGTALPRAGEPEAELASAEA